MGTQEQEAVVIPLPRRPARRRTKPVYRAIVAVDIEGSTQRTNPVKEELRHTVYELFAQALEVAGIEEHQLERLTDRGDGLLALVRPSDEVPKTRLLDPLLPELSRLLAKHNDRLPEGDTRRLRLRAVIHAGEVHDDGKGFFGESLDIAFRLLDAPRLKKELRATSAPLVLIISEEIFSTIVTHGYEEVRGGEYDLRVGVRVGGILRNGRIHVPGH